MAFNFVRLKNWQRENRYTQVIASQVLGMSQSYYATLIAGGKSPSFKTLEKICSKTGYNLNDFYISDEEALRLKAKIESERPIRKGRADSVLSGEEER